MAETNVADGGFSLAYALLLLIPLAMVMGFITIGCYPHDHLKPYASGFALYVAATTGFILIRRGIAKGISQWQAIPAIMLCAIIYGGIAWGAGWMLFCDLIYFTSGETRKIETTITRVFRGSRGDICAEIFDKELGKIIDSCRSWGRMQVRNPTAFQRVSVQTAVSPFGVRLVSIDLPDHGKQ